MGNGVIRDRGGSKGGVGAEEGAERGCRRDQGRGN